MLNFIGLSALDTTIGSIAVLRGAHRNNLLLIPIALIEQQRDAIGTAI